MSKQARGFSGVSSLSSSKDALIPPHVLAQSPNWNPLRQSADEAKKTQWDKLREQVSMDDWIERQDSNMLTNINRLEHQFADRINAGQSQSTDQELFPGRQVASHKEKEAAKQSTSAKASSASSARHSYKHQQHHKDHGSDINWSMWAAAICLFLVGIGAFAVWMFSGQPNVSNIIERYTSDVAPKSAQQDSQVAANSETPNESSAQSPAVSDSAANQALDMWDDEDPSLAQSPADADTTDAATTALDMFADDGDIDSSVDTVGSDSSKSSDSPADSATASNVPNNAAGRAEQMSDFLFNQDPQEALAAALAANQNQSADASQSSERILLSPITEVSADSVLSITLPALPKLKRPADNALNKDALSPEEYRWCALVQMGTTEVSKLPDACSSQEVVRYGQDVMPYLPYFKVLGLYRALIEQKREPMSIGVYLDPLEVDQWMDYKLSSESDALNERDTHHCGQSWVVINGYFAMSQFGFTPDALNQQIKHFNTLCSKKTVPLAEQQKWVDRNDMLVFVQSMLVVNFDKLVSNWTNFTYLPPAQGTAKQRKNEITEAQKLLQQLGYKISNTNGSLNDETREAIKSFEQDMALEAKGDLTFSILLRLRLATQGYDSKQAWQTPLKKV